MNLVENVIKKTFVFCFLAILLFQYETKAQIENYSNVRDVLNSTTEQVLDLTISLYIPWADITDDIRTEYETAIESYADGIYQITNGGHRLGKVRIFCDSKFNNLTDIIWIENGRANAHINGFRTINGRRIQMSDNFSWRAMRGGNASMLERVGYTLAHESGHYIYSVYDEYVLNTGDVAVIPSIMNNQSNAINGNHQWLNFSTSINIGDLTKTEQGRRYETDAWTVITRLPSDDPFQMNPVRTQYSVLNGRAPTAADQFTDPSGTVWPWIRNVSLATARDSLQIIWMSNAIDIDLTLDVSGSMAGQPIEDLKNASKAFVRAITDFSDNLGISTSIGITSFSNTPSDIYPITAITAGNVNDIISVIDGLSDGGLTAMYDACLVTRDKLIMHETDDPVRIGMLFTDGAENNSIEKNPDNVIAAFRNHDIPIFSFGYGNGDYHTNAQQLSSGTNGQFFANLSDASGIINEWMRIFDNAADLQYSMIGEFSESSHLEFIIDPTVEASVLQISYQLTDQNSYCDPVIRDNNGNIVQTGITKIPLTNNFPREELALVSISSSVIENAAKGNWTCTINSNGLVTPEISARVKIKGKPQGTYSLVLDDASGGYHNASQPLLLVSSVGKSRLITGIEYNATITSPSGTITTVDLNDLGQNGDAIAHDGTYSANYSNFPEDGQYLYNVYASNSQGNAFYAIDGVEYEIPPLDFTFDTVYISENFSRTNYKAIHVTDAGQMPDSTSLMMDFEDASLWSMIWTSGVLKDEFSIRSAGNASLQIQGNYYQQIKSIDVSTASLQPVSNKIALDVFIGGIQNNQWWIGQVQLLVNCPSAGIYNQYIGHAELTGQPLDQFSTFEFNIPPNIMQVLNDTYEDFSFSIAFNTNAGTGSYYLDKLRFEY